MNHKLKIMNVATAMATLGMANTRGLEDPSIGPMLLSHACGDIHFITYNRLDSRCDLRGRPPVPASAASFKN